MTTRGAGLIVLVLGIVLTFGAERAHGLEAFDVYEDWRMSLMGADRWGGNVDIGAQELNREVLVGDGLRMRLRKQDLVSSNSGFTSARHRLSFAQPLSVNQIDADLRVDDQNVTGCQENPFPSRSEAVALSPNKFSDGTPGGPGDLTGDHFGRILVYRASDSTEPAGTMRVEAILPFSNIAIASAAANCTAVPTETDVRISVGVVKTNTSAIVP